jgi:hypothetical protein
MFCVSHRSRGEAKPIVVTLLSAYSTTQHASDMGGMARSLLAASFCLCNVAGFAPRSQPSALRHAMQTQTQMRLGDESAASEPRHQPVSARLAAFVLGGLLTLQPGAPPSSLLLPHALATPPSSATTSAGSRVNKDAESLLRCVG